MAALRRRSLNAGNGQRIYVDFCLKGIFAAAISGNHHEVIYACLGIGITCTGYVVCLGARRPEVPGVVIRRIYSSGVDREVYQLWRTAGIEIDINRVDFWLPYYHNGPLDGTADAAGIPGFQRNVITTRWTWSGVGMRKRGGIRWGNSISLTISEVPDKYCGVAVGNVLDIDCIRGAASTGSVRIVKTSANHNRLKYYIDRVFVRASAGVGDGERGPPFAKSRVSMNLRRVSVGNDWGRSISKIPGIGTTSPRTIAITGKIHRVSCRRVAWHDAIPYGILEPIA
jgi:hypothetical protein